MSDFEYFGTISAFVLGFVFLIYLFRIRHRVIKMARLRIVQAKAKIHNMTKLSEPEVDIWNQASGQRRDLR